MTIKFAKSLKLIHPNSLELRLFVLLVSISYDVALAFVIEFDHTLSVKPVDDVHSCLSCVVDFLHLLDASFQFLNPLALLLHPAVVFHLLHFNKLLHVVLLPHFCLSSPALGADLEEVSTISTDGCTRTTH